MSRKQWVSAVAVAFVAIAGFGAWLAPSLPFEYTEYALPKPKSMPIGLVAGNNNDMWFATSSGLGRMTFGGEVTEVDLRENSFPQGHLVFGPDGALWFSEMVLGTFSVSGSGGVSLPFYQKVGRFDPSTGRITEFAVRRTLSFPDENGVQGAGGYLGKLAAGADGAIWFVITHNPATKFSRRFSSLGRIDVHTGQLDEYGVPGLEDADSELIDLAQGPDNALWAILKNTSDGKDVTRLQRFDLASHDWTEYMPSSPNSGLADLTVGPDGVLWFAETAIDKIGRIDPVTKDIKEIPIPGTPASLAVGPDGALWFALDRGKKIGRLSEKDDSVVTYPWKASCGQIGSIAAGSNKSLWITCFDTDRIVRLVGASAGSESAQLKTSHELPSVKAVRATMPAVGNPADSGLPTTITHGSSTSTTDSTGATSNTLVLEADPNASSESQDVAKRESVSLLGRVEFGHDAAGGKYDLIVRQRSDMLRYVWQLSDADQDKLVSLDGGKQMVKVECTLLTLKNGESTLDNRSAIHMSW